MISNEEKVFLVLMAECARIQEEYAEFHARVATSVGKGPHGAKLVDSKGRRGINELRKALYEAGRTLGLMPRFNIIPDDGHLRLQPINGSAERMLRRYDELLLQFELSQDV